MRPMAPGAMWKLSERGALRAISVVLALLALAGCTPQMALLHSLLPDGTTSILLSHLQGEEEGNRRRIMEMESRKDWDGLVKLAEENLAKDKKNIGWWMVAGHANTQLGRHQRAIQFRHEMMARAASLTSSSRNSPLSMPSRMMPRNISS